MNIIEDTKAYEAWLGQFTTLQDDDLAYKHALMSDSLDPFPFFRGTYYRWLRLWPDVCPELIEAPHLSAVGDLHVENFGTWRDAEGRLSWGVNDFDEVSELPYTNDLVRLACSVRFAREAGPLRIRLGQACSAILKGYRSTLEKEGSPFVIEEHHAHLRRLAFHKQRDPVPFWKKLTNLLTNSTPEVPSEAKSGLLVDLPHRGLSCEFRMRPRTGVGSLGKPRYLALVEWKGGWVAREAKVQTPTAASYLVEAPGPLPRIERVVRKAIRSHDPFYRVEKGYILRRLSPRCSRIELAKQSQIEDQTALLEAMGAETANVHLGNRAKIADVRRDLEQRPKRWLKKAARDMYRAIIADWEEWRAEKSKK